MPNIIIVFHILIILEMIFINLYQVNLVSKKRFSGLTTYLTLGIITTIIIIGSFLLITKNKNYGNGNGLFILIGSIYIIPLKYLYDQPLRKTLIVLYSSWVYTTLAFTIGVQIGRMFDPNIFAYITFIVQTLYYLITFYIFEKYIKKHYKGAIDAITDKISGKYLITAFLMYLSLILINYTFIMEIKIMALISFIILGITCTFSFYFIFSLINTTKNNIELSKLTYIDSLTNIPNRNYLIVQFEKYKKEHLPFSLTFIDLDSFKKINDNYGHNIGDKYLQIYSKNMKTYLNNKGEIYRLYGDEFILLSKYCLEDINNILDNSTTFFVYPFPKKDFYGFSYGTIMVTDEITLDKALRDADNILYNNKNKKRCND